jgi:lipoate-protein ligase A
MITWRLLDTGTLPAALNMAVDRTLLEAHVGGESPPTLRFYQWRPPAISLGYFQRRHSIDLAACRHEGLDVVRRPTGGRAVLHLHDLTYSIIAGVRDGIPFSLEAAYRFLCKGLLAGFRLLGLETELGRENARAFRADICFMRSAVGDIVFQGKKFVGSAQTWSGSSMLQHGSITLQPQSDTWARILTSNDMSRETICEELKAKAISLQEILGQNVEIDEVKKALKEGMVQVLQTEFQSGELSSEEWAQAKRVASNQVHREEILEHNKLLR